MLMGTIEIDSYVRYQGVSKSKPKGRCSRGQRKLKHKAGNRYLKLAILIRARGYLTQSRRIIAHGVKGRQSI